MSTRPTRKREIALFRRVVWRRRASCLDGDRERAFVASASTMRCVGKQTFRGQRATIVPCWYARAVDDELINQWRTAGVITHTQAERLTADVKARGVSRRAVSTTLFVSALMNGAVIALFTALYGMNESLHAFVLLWIACVLPMVYVIRRGALTALLALLFYIWIALFVFRGLGPATIVPRLFDLPPLLLAAGVFVFAIGGAHFSSEKLARVARTLRMAGLQMAALMLLVLSTPIAHPGFVTTVGTIGTTSQLTIGFIVVTIAAAVALVWNVALRKNTPQITAAEGPISLAMLALTALYFFVPLPKSVYAHGFSLVMLAMCATAVYVAHDRGDLRLLRLAGPAAITLFAVKFASLAWGELSMGLLVAGVVFIVVVGAMLQSGLARQIKARPPANA